MARHWFHGRFQASALPLGGLGPAAKSVREGFQRRWLVRRSSASQGGISLPRGAGSAQNRPRPVAGWADAPLPGPAAQGAPILPGGQWRPGFGRESSGRPGRHPPLDGCRPARGPGGLPGRSLSLSLGRESEARTSGATGVSYLSEGPAGKKKGFRGFPRLFVTFSRQRK